MAVLKSRKKLNNKKNWARVFVRSYKNKNFLKLNFKTKKTFFKWNVKTSYFFNFFFTKV